MTDIAERLHFLAEISGHAELGEAAAEFDRLRSELENANTQRERTLDECERMAAEIERLRERLDKADAQIQRLQAWWLAVEAERDTARAEIERLRKDVQTLMPKDFHD